MKKITLYLVFMFLIVSSQTVQAQEWSPGLDIYSSYVWRGAKFGSGPAFQPYVDFSAGGFSAGAWGSVNASTDEAYEMDLYASYGFDFGLSFTVTDYYFGGEYFDSDMHFIEPSIGFELGGFSFTGAYMLGADVGDAYVEAGYGFGAVDLFVGAGNGQYTKDGEFMVCNIGLSTSKEIEITEKFSLPLSGSVILNPSTEAFHIVVGVSF
jgi:hypothetical protein